VSEAAIRLQGLSVRLGTQPVLHQLTGELTGRAVGLLGPNGAGKTTLIHTLLGFHRPAAGTAEVLGRPLGELEVRAEIGHMPEGQSLVPGISGVRFVRLMGALAGLPPRVALERAHEALFFVGLAEARYRPVDGYSLGMKQRVKLAQALVHGPRLLFLDEPTNGLDPDGRRRMLELIRAVRDAGETTVVLSSHLLPEVESCCDQVLVLDRGRVALLQDLDDESHTDRTFLELEVRAGTGAFPEALAELGCTCGVQGGRRLTVILPPELGVRDVFRVAVQQGVQIRRLRPRRDSLEDLFLRALEASHGGP
jgi:ABC-2 type transport system ATP-binding protein